MSSVTVGEMKKGVLVISKVRLIGGSKTVRDKIEDAVEELSRKTITHEKRVIYNEEEYKEGKRLQTAIKAALEKVCAKTQYGKICPEYRTLELETVVSEAQAHVFSFNKNAETCKLDATFCFFDTNRGAKELYVSILKDISVTSKSIKSILEKSLEDALAAAPPSILKGKPLTEILADKKLLSAYGARAQSYLVRQQVKTLLGQAELLSDDLAEEARTLIEESRGIAKRLITYAKDESEEEPFTYDAEILDKTEKNFLLYSKEAGAGEEFEEIPPEAQQPSLLKVTVDNPQQEEEIEDLEEE